MAENVAGASELVNIKKALKKKPPAKRSHWAAKNSLRRIRRKRSKTRYYKSLKKLRYNRKTEDDLCSAVLDFDICDMDWAPSSSSVPLPPEIAEWKQQDQVAYWKSRALSLEMENRMLHEHLRNVYAKAVEDQAQYRDFAQSNNEAENNGENIEEEKSTTERKKYKRQKKERPPTEEKTASTEEENVKSNIDLGCPREPEGKNRLEEMTKIYGELAPKIMGMETALQLNYERIISKSNPPCWPSIPLRLSFN